MADEQEDDFAYIARRQRELKAEGALPPDPPGPACPNCHGTGTIQRNMGGGHFITTNCICQYPTDAKKIAEFAPPDAMFVPPRDPMYEYICNGNSPGARFYDSLPQKTPEEIREDVKRAHLLLMRDLEPYNYKVNAPVPQYVVDGGTIKRLELPLNEMNNPEPPEPRQLFYPPTITEFHPSPWAEPPVECVNENGPKPYPQWEEPDVEWPSDDDGA
jgi:hypothetical protein